MLPPAELKHHIVSLSLLYIYYIINFLKNQLAVCSLLIAFRLPPQEYYSPAPVGRNSRSYSKCPDVHLYGRFCIEDEDKTPEPTSSDNINIIISSHTDSNRKPSDYRSDALPIVLWEQIADYHGTVERLTVFEFHLFIFCFIMYILYNKFFKKSNIFKCLFLDML